MSQTQHEYLSLELVKPLISARFGEFYKKGRKRIYSSSSGVSFAIVFSSEYEGHKLWTCYDIDMLINEKIDYLIVVAAFYGVFFIPQKLLIEYQPHTTKLKRERDKLNIQLDGETSYLFSSTKDKKFDISDFFVEYDGEEELSSLDKNKILQDAINFRDYDEQYVEGKVSKIRKESKIQKERIAILENHTCQICGFYQEYKNEDGKLRWIIEVDHIKEKSKGGGETIDNLLVLCPNCHAKKTFGVITIGKDYRVFENGIEKELVDHHLKIKHSKN